MSKIQFQSPDDKEIGNISSIFISLRQILQHLDIKRKKQLCGMLILQIIGGFAEVISLGALLPFLSILSNLETFVERKEIKFVIEILQLQTTQSLFLFFSITFVMIFILVALFKLFIFWLQIRVGVAIGHDLNSLFFSRLMNQNLEYHLYRNSGTLISRISYDLTGTLNFIVSSLQIITQCITISFIILALLFYHFLAATSVILLVGGIYYLIMSSTRKVFVKNGRIVSDNKAEAIRQLQIGLSGIRDIILNNLQKEFTSRYARADRNFRVASAKSRFFNVAPRYILEIIGVATLVFIVAFYSASEEGISSILPLIGLFGMATVRILPASQGIYSEFAKMQSLEISVKRALSIASLSDSAGQELEFKDNKIEFKDNITLQNVWFRYNHQVSETNSSWILQDISLTIPANKTIAFVGKTGGGKSTISDILLGLLYPVEGKILVDGKTISQNNVAAWRNTTASVPQFIFLLDATIRENISFGQSKNDTDLDKVFAACDAAEVTEFLKQKKLGVDEVIGENGLRLSGGQRQRIGIARALYKDASLIVFDEATSSLDNHTEKTIMNSIDSLHGHQTIVLIAHRLTTIRKADIIYEISDGKIIAQGDFDYLLQNSPSFAKLVKHQLS